ncbi:putative protein farnesyltransferase [Rosa chinensis]|uniref:Prenyltransferase alpha-alpha toroid domain-containing protein n=1 Tax=Rosa chinensis TaxID=74649 RepID=A0A2P6S1X6_ROSCH|nr:putative protein farnesyltransferase [Rosa chinensis]
MILINEVNCLDLPRLIDWLVFRQGKECGFQGRTNKLVDGCYSFWQGSAFALLQRIPSVSEEQIVLLDVGHCNLDTSHTSTTSRISEVDNSSEGTSSQVDDTRGFSQEGLKAPFPVNYNDIGYDFINRSVEMKPLFHAIALQRYILLCTQIVVCENRKELQYGGLGKGSLLNLDEITYVQNAVKSSTI